MSNKSITNKPVKHVEEALLPKGFRKERTRVLTDSKTSTNKDKSVIYWMQRDVRTVDNWALVLASHLAKTRGQILRVVYVLPPPSAPPENGKEDIPKLVNLPVNARHADFLLGGLELVHKELHDMNIPMHIVEADCHDNVGKAVHHAIMQYDPSMVVSDFSPIREYRQWMEVQFQPLSPDIPFYQVDAHNIVPVWAASDKREYAARTIRPKIHKVLDDFLDEFPQISSPNKKDDNKNVDLPTFQRKEYEMHMKIDHSVKPVDWAKPGTEAALEQFHAFCKDSLDDFGNLRNDPNQDVTSNLSPWINHGHVSAQRLAMKMDELGGRFREDDDGSAAFVEESVIRRELADNFVYYTPNEYDSLEAAYNWAKETLDKHRNDPREYIYSLNELEEGKTHEDIWNAAQMQLVQEGHMHGFLRMYWSKKVCVYEHNYSSSITSKDGSVFGIESTYSACRHFHIIFPRFWSGPRVQKRLFK